MGIQIQPTEDGGRVVSGSTPFGDVYAEWDADGVLLDHRITIRGPHANPLPRRLVAHRIRACRGCDQLRRVSTKRKGHAVYRVQCKACGCGGLSLASGECPEGKWT